MRLILKFAQLKLVDVVHLFIRFPGRCDQDVAAVSAGGCSATNPSENFSIK